MAFIVIGVVGFMLLVLALGVGDLLDGALDTIDVFDTGWLSTAAIGGFLGALGLVGWAVEPSAGPTIATLAAWPQVCSLAASPGGWPGRSRPAPPTAGAGAAIWSGWRQQCSPRSPPGGTAKSRCA